MNSDSEETSDSDDGFFHLFDSEEEYMTTNYKYDNKELTMQHLGSHLCNTHWIGQLIWPAAHVLSHYITANKEFFRDKVVLELGAGPALCGFYAAFYAKKVIITDYKYQILELIEKNAKLNNITNVEIQNLYWGRDLEEFKEKLGHVDIIIGSGIIYETEVIVPLLETVGALLPKHEEGEDYSDVADGDVTSDEDGPLKINLPHRQPVFITCNNNYRFHDDEREEIFDGAADRLGLHRVDVSRDDALEFALKEEEAGRASKVYPDYFQKHFLLHLTRK